jgi:transcriptional regulator with XRE-family HTH domain
MTATSNKKRSLSERRRELGLSRPELAKLAGCSVQSINNFEQGFLPKRSEVLERVEAALSERENKGRGGTAVTGRRSTTQESDSRAARAA